MMQSSILLLQMQPVPETSLIIFGEDEELALQPLFCILHCLISPPFWMGLHSCYLISNLNAVALESMRHSPVNFFQLTSNLLSEKSLTPLPNS